LFVQTRPQQLGLESIMALRAERMAIFETIIGEGLSEVDAGVF
jgi:hypothetical protein